MTDVLAAGSPGTAPAPPQAPTPDEVLAALDPEQRAAATSLDGPLCILAGAGTGKTRAITHRIAYAVLSGRWQAQTVLAVTFTTRAAGEMRTRLRELGVTGVQARTFHSAALRQARYFWPQVYHSELPPIVSSKLRFVAEAAARCRVPADLAGRRDLAGEIEWAKVSNVRPDDYPTLAAKAGRQLAGYDAATVSHVFAAYEEIRRDRGQIDLEDVLLCAVALLADAPKVAAAIRSQYRHFVVDEYQDVSPVQQTLLDLWLGDRSDVCVVGDASQTIYSFAGASPSYLLDFTRRHQDATVVRLERDYRSTPQVVKVANGLLAGARGEASRHRLTLRAQRPDGPPPVFTEYADEVEEADAVARAVQRLASRGTPLREIAVLFRVNAQSEAFEQALAERGVRYLVRGAERFFDRPEVREAIVLLRGSVRAAETSGAGLVADVHAVLAATGWTPEPPTGSGAVRERWESLVALASLAADLAKERPDADLATFVALVEERVAAQHAPAADGVTLATLHAAKGLEWDAVFLTGIHEGTVPITYAETPDQVEEERRLLYVGVTRAREHLSISWSRSRTPGGRGRRSPSRFLSAVRPKGGAASDAGSAGTAGERGGRKATTRSVARCRSCGQPLHDASERKVGRCAECPATYDEAMFERLRGWRLEQAQEQRVPAYCVFTDATLIAIAEARPSAQSELAVIPGVGATKLARYADAVLAICGGDALDEAADPDS
ncbi:ATP-dependent DNA helicase UvrD2 [Actinopolymorpha pittospori]|uniref:DNA 3'-5' helicase n=1 Tax=Actinopolymorpha pittospori TaxID=648752 RepID=A0A927N413_9ACTN|nr:ATP-dependent DNA helicase UvrD2 [Actinopolymorpha pittospori]MBE1611724.1 DNA helicase-2/ATP-dependent DNA helicase PcrA [Actinopolymorpha pittospori]